VRLGVVANFAACSLVATACPQAVPTPHADTEDAGSIAVVSVDGSGSDTGASQDRVACVPNAPLCVGRYVTATCKPSGTGWGAQVACSEGAVCSQLTGLCGLTACVPDSRACQGPTAWVECHRSGTAWLDEPHACPAGLSCFAGECVTCEPGSSRCGESGGIEQCAADGSTWLGESACPAGSTC
jgi:hypothetical protein